jgi:hypothetical protein
MPTGTLKGWAFATEEKDPSHWSMKLSAEEAGFGCDERYSTSFFFLATFGDNKVSRPLGLERANQDAFEESVPVYSPV